MIRDPGSNRMLSARAFTGTPSLSPTPSVATAPKKIKKHTEPTNLSDDELRRRGGGRGRGGDGKERGHGDCRGAGLDSVSGRQGNGGRSRGRGGGVQR